jgi:hypothetical protein
MSPKSTLVDTMRALSSALLLVTALPALAALPAGPHEAFGNAHVLMMVRAQSKGHEARMVDLEVWAEGTRLRAMVRGEPKLGEFWVDGLGSKPLHLLEGKIDEPRRRSLEGALMLAFAGASSLAHANSDRIAGRPCKIITDEVGEDAKLTRCVWRGLPLSIELSQRGFSFNAAATMVEEGAVTVADLQPPPGAPSAPASMSAGN